MRKIAVHSWDSTKNLPGSRTEGLAWFHEWIISVNGDRYTIRALIETPDGHVRTIDVKYSHDFRFLERPDAEESQNEGVS